MLLFLEHNTRAHELTQCAWIGAARAASILDEWCAMQRFGVRFLLSSPGARPRRHIFTCVVPDKEENEHKKNNAVDTTVDVKAFVNITLRALAVWREATAKLRPTTPPTTPLPTSLPTQQPIPANLGTKKTAVQNTGELKEYNSLVAHSLAVLRPRSTRDPRCFVLTSGAVDSCLKFVRHDPLPPVSCVRRAREGRADQALAERCDAERAPCGEN